MKVTVKYMAQIKQAAGVGSEQVELDQPCSVQELVAGLAERRGQPLRKLLLDERGGVQPTVLLFVGDSQVEGDRLQLKDGDVVTLLSPIAGG
jgi:molybdopterin converting factor small subunit